MDVMAEITRRLLAGGKQADLVREGFSRSTIYQVHRRLRRKLARDKRTCVDAGHELQIAQLTTTIHTLTAEVATVRGELLGAQAKAKLQASAAWDALKEAEKEARDAYQPGCRECGRGRSGHKVVAGKLVCLQPGEDGWRLPTMKDTARRNASIL